MIFLDTTLTKLEWMDSIFFLNKVMVSFSLIITRPTWSLDGFSINL